MRVIARARIGTPADPARVDVVIYEAEETEHGDFSCKVELAPAVYPTTEIVGVDREQARFLAKEYVTRLFAERQVSFDKGDSE